MAGRWEPGPDFTCLRDGSGNGIATLDAFGKAIIDSTITRIGLTSSPSSFLFPHAKPLHSSTTHHFALHHYHGLTRSRLTKISPLRPRTTSSPAVEYRRFPGIQSR